MGRGSVQLGLFITFEGGEGAGKSTQIARLAQKLWESGISVTVTREPGGSPGAEAVRHVILSGTAEPFGPFMEAVLFAAARADHVEQVIRPAVQRGEVVLCDRFTDSSRVYQGATGGIAPEVMESLQRIAIAGMTPDMTLLLDIDPGEGMRRAGSRRGLDKPDRFEKESLRVHAERRAAFLAIAEAEPDRCIVVDASGTAEAVEHVVTAAVFAALDVQRGRAAAG